MAFGTVIEAPIRTRDRTMRFVTINHLAVNTITPLTGNSVNFQDKVDMGANEMSLTEMTPPTGLTNIGTIYADLSGGKTRLMAIFQTGVAQVIAAEP